MLICARKECQVEYQPKTHNQKYCGAECCRIETNRRIMEKYYSRRDQRAGKVRFCSECKITKLSRYNDTMICGGCSLRNHQDSKRNVLSLVESMAS